VICCGVSSLSDSTQKRNLQPHCNTRILQWNGCCGKSPYLFPSPATGKSYTFITYAWRTIKKKAGIPDNMRLHDLRHTFATRLVSAGCSLYEVQMLLGHADPRMTQRYAHLSPKRALDASNTGTFAIA
jgi:integrase